MPPTVLPNPVIVVPAITATNLRDEYRLPPDRVWDVALQKEYDRLVMHPDDLRYEASQPARVAADSAFQVIYQELVEELRYNLSASPAAPVPVYVFGYDWRQPLAATEARLAAFIDEVIDRTRLLRHYAKAGYAADARVNLIGHSMGGLVIAGYVAAHGASGKVGKVVTLGTPFRGSCEAALKITVGTAALGDGRPRSREREMSRLTPALYHLLPGYKGAVVTDPLPGRELSLFRPDSWQEGVLETIVSFIEAHSPTPAKTKGERLAAAAKVFKSLLDAAAAHRARVEQPILKPQTVPKGDWLCVAGVDVETRVRIRVRDASTSPVFDLGKAKESGDRANRWDGRGQSPAEAMHTGDGTVPLPAAVPAFLEPERVVCVCPGDFAYWELKDKLLSLPAAGEFHGALPTMDLVHRLIVRHFTGRGDEHRSTWGRPLPGVAADRWNPPLLGLRNKDAE